MSMQFVMNTDLSTALPKVIDFNHEALKKELSVSLARYNNLVVTEGDIKGAKDDRARLNALKTAIETQRKDTKKAWLQPYSEFEAKCKELTALIDEPITAIDTQLAAFEEKRKAEKMAEIEALYAESVNDTIKDIIPLSRILDPKWLNKTVSREKVKEAILNITKRTFADLLALDTVPAEHAAAVRAKYIETLDVGAALQHMKDLRAAADAFREREAAKAKETPTEAVKPAQKPVQAADGTLYSLRLEFTVTKEQANLLKRFLVENGIRHQKI